MEVTPLNRPQVARHEQNDPETLDFLPDRSGSGRTWLLAVPGGLVEGTGGKLVEELCGAFVGVGWNRPRIDLAVVKELVTRPR